MRRILITFVLSFAVAGCLMGDPGPGPGDGGQNQPDLARGGGGGGGGGAGGGAGGDMAGGGPVDMSQSASTDLAGSSLKPFGADCTLDTDCVTMMCRQFQMGAVHKCTQPCTPATAAQDCPNPPSTGLCTNNGYCKF